MASEKIPQIRRHKTHQRAYVSYDGGKRQKYFGVAGDWPSNKRKPPAHVLAEYDEWLGRYLAHGRTVPTEQVDRYTVNDVLLAYDKHAEAYYQPARDNSESCELDNLRYALKPLKELFGSTDADDFGALSFKLVRRSMIDRKWTRRHINGCCNKIVRLFRWAAEEEMIPAEVWYKLKAVKSLRENTPGVKEKPLPEGVLDQHVQAALPYMTRPVAAMVRLQLLTGMRPGEVVRMRGCDLKISDDGWEYKPGSDKGRNGDHKTSHLGKQRIIALGPQAQELLRPWLKPDPTAYLFDPSESEEERHAERRAKRKTPMTPSQRKRTRAKIKSWGRYYKPKIYARNIARACVLADVPVWSPNKLRHAVATMVEEKFGTEAARVVLGHSKVETTQLYIHRDKARAKEIAQQIG